MRRVGGGRARTGVQLIGRPTLLASKRTKAATARDGSTKWRTAAHVTLNQKALWNSSLAEAGRPADANKVWRYVVGLLTLGYITVIITLYIAKKL